MSRFRPRSGIFAFFSEDQDWFSILHAFLTMGRVEWVQVIICSFCDQICYSDAHKRIFSSFASHATRFSSLSMDRVTRGARKRHLLSNLIAHFSVDFMLNMSRTRSSLAVCFKVKLQDGIDFPRIESEVIVPVTFCIRSFSWDWPKSNNERSDRILYVQRWKQPK